MERRSHEKHKCDPSAPKSAYVTYEWSLSQQFDSSSRIILTTASATNRKQKKVQVFDKEDTNPARTISWLYLSLTPVSYTIGLQSYPFL